MGLAKVNQNLRVFCITWKFCIRTVKKSKLLCACCDRWVEISFAICRGEPTPPAANRAEWMGYKP